MPHLEEHNFSAPAEVHSFSALLFDMDGTIIDSTNAIVKHWHQIGKEIGVDPEVILATSHGRRSIDVLEILEPKLANWEFSAEQVAKGKPDPACYKLGAQRLNITSDDVLVLEDAPAGVRAGIAAGYKVVALATTHTVQQLQEAGATWIVRDMRSVTMKNFDKKTGRVEITIADALVQ
ncbi:unnamed protein product [Aureobasidium mustum]|uniref:HAD-like protein n=1 Tax=Aureobasidium mustum TaxID=2773714 RepID=A0A9N8PJM7_9PEZI|nr:unnamed protein product [Aureobasidium mustum]